MSPNLSYVYFPLVVDVTYLVLQGIVMGSLEVIALSLLPVKLLYLLIRVFIRFGAENFM